MSHLAGSARALLARPDLGRVVFDLVLVAILALFISATPDLRPGSRLVPLIVAVPTLLGMLVRTTFDVGRWARHRSAEAEPEPIDALQESEDESRRQRWFALWAVAFVVVAVLSTNYLPGIFGLNTYFVPAAAIGLVVLLRAVRVSWLKTLLITGGLLTFLYYLLAVFLHARL